LTDVGTTKRKPLTPRKRLALFEAFKGKCCLCDLPIRPGDKWIDEHLRALGLGGTNEWDNRGPAHVECAAKKTKDDMARINKAKDQKMKHLGIAAPKAKIAVRPKPLKVKREKLPLPPRQSMFREAAE
jgi:5-methylcytosine-specific restriction protein A